MAQLVGFLVVCVWILCADAASTPKDEREKLEPYMRTVVRLSATNDRYKTRIVSTHFANAYVNETHYYFIFDDILGAVVHAGFKTREVHLNKAEHPCPGLNKLYEYVDQYGIYHLTTNYLDVNNVGDRQPIGLCAPKKGMCGADVELNEYASNLYLYYGSSENNILGLQNLKKNRTICYIFTRSSEQIKTETEVKKNQNFQYATLSEKIVHVYAVRNGSYTVYKTLSNATADEIKQQKAELAFNLIKPGAKDSLKNVCDMRPIAQYKNTEGKTVLFDDPERDEELRKLNYKPYPNEQSYIIGYGLQRLHYCGSRLKYEIREDPQSGNVRAVYPSQQGHFTKRFFNAFFYSF